MEGILFIGWLILCGLVAFIAGQRGRSPLAWFVVSFFLSPLVGYAVLVAIPLASEGPAVAPMQRDKNHALIDDSPIFKGERD